ncbi:hypothetical protein [Ruminococcus flavefaciens]|uniref:hypothetical protein n=1 Tax=Ruminococcus flavefaciens TaxID=1265 RepID=UPI0004921C52
MKKRHLLRFFLMGYFIPLSIFLISDLIDIICKEYGVMGLLVLEGSALFILPIIMLGKEQRAPKGKALKRTSVMFLCGYAAAAITALIIQMIIEDTDLADKLFPGVFLRGIGFTLICMVLVGGFFWAVIFRVTVAMIRFIKSKKK